MTKFDWLLGGLSIVMLAAAAVASDKPQSSVTAPRQVSQVPQVADAVEVAVSETQSPQHCPCCELPCNLLPGGETGMWFVLNNFAPFLGYMAEQESHDPHTVVADFIRSVAQGDFCFDCDVVLAAGECKKCENGKCADDCKCADGKKCACAAATTASCPCKPCDCAKKTCACGPNCKCAANACNGENCPCQPSAPRGVWMRPPVAPPVFGIHWHPFPMPAPPPWAPPEMVWAEMPPPGLIPPPVPYPVVQYHAHPPFPRILPPVAEEHHDPYGQQVVQAPAQPAAPQIYPMSRSASHRPTPPARPASGQTAQLHVNGNHVRYATASFVATCEHLSCHGNVVVLEGNVQVWLRPGASQQTGTISAQRVEVNVDTGDFNVTGAVNQVHNEMPIGVVPSSFKEEGATPPSTRPVQR